MSYFISCVKCDGGFYGFDCVDFEEATAMADSEVRDGRAVSAEVFEPSYESVYTVCAD